jgi:hypothetical protein
MDRKPARQPTSLKEAEHGIRATTHIYVTHALFPMVCPRHRSLYHLSDHGQHHGGQAGGRVWPGAAGRCHHLPISYIFGDVLTEVYGYRRARRVIWLGFLCNLIAVLAIWVGQVLPAASFWDEQAA